ncbi:MAG: hypothetical protein K2W97_07270 [Chthoniobacterales bacterium]|nr:hypothetical protein [Chthoniobacterales bacterium]
MENLFHGKHQKHGVPVASNPVGGSQKSDPIAKELSSSKGLERQAEREWKKVSIYSQIT